jgi:hypothetical protein
MYMTAIILSLSAMSGLGRLSSSTCTSRAMCSRKKGETRDGGLTTGLREVSESRILRRWRKDREEENIFFIFTKRII